MAHAQLLSSGSDKEVFIATSPGEAYGVPTH